MSEKRVLIFAEKFKCVTALHARVRVELWSIYDELQWHGNNCMQICCRNFHHRRRAIKGNYVVPNARYIPAQLRALKRQRYLRTAVSAPSRSGFDISIARDEESRCSRLNKTSVM